MVADPTIVLCRERRCTAAAPRNPATTRAAVAIVQKTTVHVAPEAGMRTGARKAMDLGMRTGRNTGDIPITGATNLASGIRSYASTRQGLGLAQSVPQNFVD